MLVHCSWSVCFRRRLKLAWAEDGKTHVASKSLVFFPGNELLQFNGGNGYGCDFIAHRGLSIFSHLTTNVLPLNSICFLSLDCVFSPCGSFPFALFHILYFLRAMILQPSMRAVSKQRLEFVKFILCKKGTCLAISRTNSPYKWYRKMEQKDTLEKVLK